MFMCIRVIVLFEFVLSKNKKATIYIEIVLELLYGEGVCVCVCVCVCGGVINYHTADFEGTFREVCNYSRIITYHTLHIYCITKTISCDLKNN